MPGAVEMNEGGNQIRRENEPKCVGGFRSFTSKVDYVMRDTDN